MEDNISRITVKVLSMEQPACKRALKIFLQKVPLSENQIGELKSVVYLRSDGLPSVFDEFEACRKAIRSKAGEFQRASEFGKASRLLEEIHESMYGGEGGKSTRAEIEKRAAKNISRNIDNILELIDSGKFERAMDLIMP